MPVLALILALLLGGGGLRVIVRVPDGEGELLRRIEGQTVDLQPPVTLTPLPGPLEPEPEAQVRAAAALGRERGAAVVVWVRRLPDGAAVVCVADAAGGQLLERRVGRGANLVARSAEAEGAALVVRSALRALLRGERVGDAAPALAAATGPAPRPTMGPAAGRGTSRASVAEAADASRAQAAPSPATRDSAAQAAAASRALAASRAASSAPGAPAAAPPALALELGVGWQVALGGASPPGQHGLLLRGGLRRGPWSASLTLLGGLPAHLRDDLTDVELSRHGALIQGAYCAPLRRGLCLGAALGAGALLHYRRTEALSAAAQPADPRALPALLLQPAAVLGLGAELLGQRWPLRAELALGADVVLPTPALGYDVDGQLRARDALWPVQPRLGLTLLYHRHRERVRR